MYRVLGKDLLSPYQGRLLCAECCEEICYHHIRGDCCVQGAVKKTCYHHIRGDCCVQGAVKRLVVTISGETVVYRVL